MLPASTAAAVAVGVGGGVGFAADAPAGLANATANATEVRTYCMSRRPRRELAVARRSSGATDTIYTTEWVIVAE